jgi:hypothetical protein
VDKGNTLKVDLIYEKKNFKVFIEKSWTKGIRKTSYELLTTILSVWVPYPFSNSDFLSMVSAPKAPLV